MKEKLFKAIAIVSLIIAVISLFSVISLKKEISHLNNTLNMVNQQYADLKSEVLNNVETALEEYDKSFAEASYEYKDYKLDAKNPNAKILIQVLPKSYDPDITRVYLVDKDNKEYTLEYADGRYKGDINIPLFAHLYITHVVSESNGTLNTQMLNWDIAPEEEVFPEINIHNYGDISSYNPNDVNKTKVTFTPDLMIELMESGNSNAVDFKGGDVVVQRGDKEIDRIKLQKDESGEFAAPAVLSLSDNERTYKIKPGETLEFYVEIKEDNFTIRRLLDLVSIDDKGNSILDEKVSEYQYNENITVKHNDEIIYDIRDEIIK